jgi:hypothetical protein
VIKDILAAYAHATRRVFGDRTGTVGASEIGQCARKTYWVKKEADPKSGAERDAGHVDGWGARTRGSVFESGFWEPALRAKYGDDLLLAGQQQFTLISEFLSATPDGLVINQPRDALAALGVPDLGEGHCFAAECKTVDPRSVLDGPKPEHVLQAQVQLGLIRKQTKYKPEYAVITYTDASLWDVVREFVVRFEEKVFANAKARARQILTALSASELPPEGWIAGGRECRWCPFTKACGRDRTNVPRSNGATADPQFVAEVVDLARAIKAQESAADAANTSLRTMQNGLKERLREKGVNKIAGEGVSVTWSSVKGRPSFDMKAIGAAATLAGVDVTQFSTVGDLTMIKGVRVAMWSRLSPWSPC